MDNLSSSLGRVEDSSCAHDFLHTTTMIQNSLWAEETCLLSVAYLKFERLSLVHARNELKKKEGSLEFSASVDFVVSNNKWENLW
jgi:hypothetical protein